MKHARGKQFGAGPPPLDGLQSPLQTPMHHRAPAEPEPAHRRTICVWLPRFRSEVEAHVRPDPLNRPISVFDPSRRRRPLLEPPDEGHGSWVKGHREDASPYPMTHDPRPMPHVGLALREAETHWPDV